MKENTKIVIAIDGHSSTGKSTVAKELAQHLNYIYVDTGAMYRAVALFALQQKFITDNLNTDALINALPQIQIDFKKDTNGGLITFLNHTNVEGQIRSLEVSNWVSDVAAIPQVRKKLVEQQQKIGSAKGVVLDGRDIGTVVFPDAELKLFMTASAEIRAERRFKELQAKGDTQVNFEAVLENVQKRDHIDSTRKDSPLLKAADAHLIDNSNLSKEAQFNLILDLVQEKTSVPE